MVTAVSNLHMLQSAAFAEMIASDEMFLPQLGVEKRAIFCVIPDNDDTFNFMVSILYTQLFDQLFRLADSTPEFHGTLPVHVRLMMDEFANVATPENFVKILAVARSRNISCDIILQNISQIKSKYKDDLPVYADDPLATINALSDFVFSAIKAIGAILLGFGIVQIGLALKSHDAGQRAQGFMTFFGGVVIYFAKDILDMIL